MLRIEHDSQLDIKKEEVVQPVGLAISVRMPNKIVVATITNPGADEGSREVQMAFTSPKGLRGLIECLLVGCKKLEAEWDEIMEEEE